MPRLDGTGPRGEGMFTGRGQGYCALRLPEASSGEPAVGYAGIEGRPMEPAADSLRPLVFTGANEQTQKIDAFLRQGRRCRCGRRRHERQRLAAR